MPLFDLISHNAPWAWVIAGFVLLGLELAVPGGVFVWLGVAGLITGLAAFVQPIGWPMQLTIFGILSLVTVIGWQGYARRRGIMSDSPLLNRRAERYVGHEAIIDEPIKDGFGRLQLGDTIWRIAGPDLAAGARVRVVGADGPVLKVVAA